MIYFFPPKQFLSFGFVRSVFSYYITLSFFFSPFGLSSDHLGPNYPLVHLDFFFVISRRPVEMTFATILSTLLSMHPTFDLWNSII